MRIARIKIRVDSQGRWERAYRRKRNFEEVCFESGTEYYWQRKRVSGIRRELIPESWTDDRESPFAK